MRPSRYATAALGCAALAVLAGCALVGPSGTQAPGAGTSGTTAAGRPAATTTATPAPETTGTAVAAADYRCPAPSPSPRANPASRELAARLQARVLLCDFTVPRDARRLDTAPSVRGRALAGSALGQPAQDPDLVTMDKWWLVPGKPAAVLAWETRHLHSGLRRTGWGTTGQNGEPYLWYDVFSPSAAPAWVDQQGLSLTVAAHGENTVLAADALVAWFPARPAGERVPATARAVAISASYARGSEKKPPEPVTITAPGTVRKLAALINGLQVAPPGIMSCPAMPGRGLVSLTLRFRAAPGAPPLAVATDLVSGCARVSLTIGGKSQPGLLGTRVGYLIAKIAGLDWKIRLFDLTLISGNFEGSSASSPQPRSQRGTRRRRGRCLL